MFYQHNIKKLRNNVEKSSPTGSTRCLKNGDDNIFWQHWKDAYLWDQACNSCPLHEKLKEEHFQLTPSSRMRNGLAEDVLDKKMLYLMKVSKWRTFGNCRNDQQRILLATTIQANYFGNIWNNKELLRSLCRLTRIIWNVLETNNMHQI